MRFPLAPMSNYHDRSCLMFEPRYHKLQHVTTHQYFLTVGLCILINCDSPDIQELDLSSTINDNSGYVIFGLRHDRYVNKFYPRPLTTDKYVPSNHIFGFQLLCPSFGQSIIYKSVELFHNNGALDNDNMQL
ncbi:unnamed protein product [Macrosiphum euphorbiae]|uniref:Uncharacterized protein n=1 Tax=Macrosiphum euphorbiae TaxID=13131 RepID=A0AAV0WPV7_9HEMI|nr:unnamed protein product [Macrosiphum euphorbiae]